MTFSSTVKPRQRPSPCKVLAIPRAFSSWGRTPSMRRPLYKISPACGFRNPQTTLNKLVLPAPLGPMMPTISPAGTSSDTSSRATNPPKRTVSERTSRAPGPSTPAAVEELVAASTGRTSITYLVGADFRIEHRMGFQVGRGGAISPPLPFESSGRPAKALLATRLPAGLHADPAARRQPHHRAVAAMDSWVADFCRTLSRNAQSPPRAKAAGVDLRHRRHRLRDLRFAHLGPLPVQVSQRSAVRPARPWRGLPVRAAGSAHAGRSEIRATGRSRDSRRRDDLGFGGADSAPVDHRSLRPSGCHMPADLCLVRLAIAALAVVRGDLHRHRRAGDLWHLLSRLVLASHRAVDAHPVRQSAVGDRGRLLRDRRHGAPGAAWRARHPPPVLRVKTRAGGPGDLTEQRH